jgi:hypothetical protein
VCWTTSITSGEAAIVTRKDKVDARGRLSGKGRGYVKFQGPASPWKCQAGRSEKEVKSSMPGERWRAESDEVSPTPATSDSVREGRAGAQPDAISIINPCNNK